jgi:hypothetical protein
MPDGLAVTFLARSASLPSLVCSTLLWMRDRVSVCFTGSGLLEVDLSSVSSNRIAFRQRVDRPIDATKMDVVMAVEC